LQNELVFFGERHEKCLPEPTHMEKMMRIDRTSAFSPFSRFIGNDRAVKKMQTAAYTALGRDNHMMRELAFAVFGPSSAGKTTLVRLYAETVQLPFIEISPKSLKCMDDLFKIIRKTLADSGLELIEISSKRYSLPPCVIFIDEVHALTTGVVDGLLKATEHDDAMLVTENGIVCDTFNVTWAIATTDEGKLFEAFRTRFSPIVLNLLNKSDIAKIVKLSNRDWSDELCGIVAHYNSRIPRKALEFARYMRMVKTCKEELGWDEIAREVAYDEGVDEFGMHEIHLRILRALAEGPIAKTRISLVAGRKDEEVEKYILPWLLTETDDQPALICVTSKGYTITDDGLKELSKRK
jgi:Holliday junction resolvasome RuvABC ATP-dependent DNA helicase subunit